MQASGNGVVVGAQKPAVASQHTPKVVNQIAASAALDMRPVVVEAAISQPQPTRQKHKFGTKHQHRHHSEVSAKRRHRHHVEVSVVRVAKEAAP